MLYTVIDSADIASKGVPGISNSGFSGIGSSCITLPCSEIPNQGKQASVLHGNLLVLS